MRSRSAILVVSLLAAPAVGSALHAQVSPSPRAYSITELNNLLTPMTVRIYRDGARELVEYTHPASVSPPNGSHSRTLFDFSAHQQYNWDPAEPTACSAGVLAESEPEPGMDVISGATKNADQLAKMHAKPVGAETVNGIPATVLESPDPSGRGILRVWTSVKGGYLLKMAIVPKSGPPQIQLEVKELSFEKPAAAFFAVPANCGSAASPPAPAPASAPAAAAAAAAASSGLLPAGFTAPAGFVVEEHSSKVFDFFHVPVAYPKAGATARIDPEGKTWLLTLKLASPNKTSDETDAQMRAALRAQGWELLTPSGLLVAHRAVARTDTWFSGSAFSGDYRATIVEVGTAPHTLTLAAPSPTVETVDAGADFPYLKSFPGSKLLRTAEEPTRTFNAAMPGKPEELVGQPLVRKLYELPKSVSPYEFVAVYRDALTKAGWTLIRTAAGSDAQVIAHWGKNGRDIWVYLAGDGYNVADVGAQNEAKRLAAELAREGHVAIYGIYFDVDQATLKPESETALQHVLDLLKADGSLKLEVQGHTDNSGAATHNQTLSDQRAAAVTTWLVGHGVATGRLTSKGLGDTQPVGNNATPDGRAKNRRVELQRNPR